MLKVPHNLISLYKRQESVMFKSVMPQTCNKTYSVLYQGHFPLYTKDNKNIFLVVNVCFVRIYKTTCNTKKKAIQYYVCVFIKNFRRVQISQRHDYAVGVSSKLHVMNKTNVLRCHFLELLLRKQETACLVATKSKFFTLLN